MNTRIHYLYRDADNYKVQNECVILGEMTEEQEQRIIACLDEKEYFVPSRVGMPERKFDTETDSDHPWFEWERIEETGQKPTLEITAEELVKRFEEASKGWESVRTAPESGKLPYCVTVQETLSRTVIVWAAERIDAEVTAQELCNAGDIELGNKDFVDRECTCDGVAEVGDFDTFEEYGALSSRMRKLLLRKMPLSPQKRLILSTVRGAMMPAWAMPLSLWNVQTWIQKRFVRSCTLWNPASTSSR